MKHGLKKALAAAVAVPMLASLMPATAMADDGAAAATPVAASTPQEASDNSNLQLLASWDFTGAYQSQNGELTDSTGKHKLTLHNNAYIEEFRDRSNNEALQLKGNQEYAQFDDQLFAEAGDSFTMEFAAKSRHEDKGNYFTLGIGQDGDYDTGTDKPDNANKYLMFYDSIGTVKTVISDNNWGNEQGEKVSVSNNNNIWHEYKLVVDGTKLAVWRDNQLIIFKADTGLKMSDLGATTAFIGRSFYLANGDKYWNGAMDDIKVYKGADLTLPTSVAISGDGVVDGKLALVESDEAQLSAAVEPASAIGSKVTWTSSDESVATVNAEGKVTAVKAGDAVITAATEMGGVKAELPVTVTPMDARTAATADLDSAISALKTQTTENLPLIAEGTKHGSDIVWESSDEGVITGTDKDYKAPEHGAADPYRGAGVITRPAYGKGDAQPVTLTATASYEGGESVTKTVEITVKERTRTVPDGAYAAVTFLSDAHTTDGKIGEALYESATDGNDFFSFSEINNTNPVITSTTDTTGLRDPYVLKSHDGDKFYMIATDLKVSQQGWGQNQQYGSLKLEAWESTDMVNWTRTNAEDGDTGIKVNADNYGMTWAPEAFWDDELNAYVVFFSSREFTDDTRSTAVKSEKTGNDYNIVMMSITRDFKSYTPVEQWQNTQYSRIDSTVFKIGDMYYRLTKNEEGGAAGDYVTDGKSTFLERSKCLTCETTSSDPNADVNTTWQLVDQNILPFEGPESIKLNEGDPNQNEAGDAMIIMADSGGYKPYMTSESALTNSSWTSRLSQTEGWHTEKQWGPGVTGKVTPTNMPTPTRHGAFVNVSAAIASNMHRWTTDNPTTVDAADSTVSVEYDKDSRGLTAAVTAADKGNVAGSVTFSAGDWSKTETLGEKGKATVTVPESVKGEVTVAYDGYTDGLVKASSTVYDLQNGEVEPPAPTVSDPVLHYSFDNAAENGVVRNEGTAAGSDATIEGDAAIEDGQLKLTGSQSVTVPTTAIAGKQDLTVSMWLKNNYGNGDVAAAYIGSAKTGSYPSNGYWLLNPSNPSGYVKSVMTTATAAKPNGNPWSTEVGPGSTGKPTSGSKSTKDMALYTMVINGSAGTMTFYLNGRQVGDATYAIPQGGLTNYGDLVAYIGKSSYSDPNTKIDVDDYAVYDGALTAEQVGAVYADQAFAKAAAGVSVPEKATKDFTLAVESAGASIAWKSDNDAIAVDAKGNAAVTRPASDKQDATVTLTAVFTIGDKTKTKTYQVTVPRQLTDQEKAQADLDALEIESADDIRGNFSVSAKGAKGSEIGWTVAKGEDHATVGEGVNSKSRTVTVKRPASGKDAVKVTLTATVKNGTATLTKEFTVTIQPMPSSEEKDEAYIWAFFTGEGVGGEKISLAASKGNNALDWNTLNGGTPLFTSEFGEQGLRDPFIFKSKDGDKFYMLATDLKIDGRPGSFNSAQRNGSKYIEIWKSDDLVNWSKQSHVKVNSDLAGNTWAPEAYYDEEIGKYVVYWASNMYDDADESNRTKPSYNRMIYVTTDDFVNFSEPTVWIDVDRRGQGGQDGAGSIDVTVQKEGDVYYRIYKDENSMTLRQEKSTDLLAAVKGSYPGASGDADQWTTVGEKIGNGQSNGYGGTFSAGEGPSLFKANEGDVNGYQYYLFADQPNYHGGPNHYVPMATNDISDASAWKVIGDQMPEANFPTNSDGGKPRHGTVLGVTRAQYQKVLEAYAKNVAVSSVDAMDVTTTVGEAPALPQTAHLTKADGSSEDVAVVWDEVSADDYAKAGEFTVKGVAQDASRMPVEATVKVEGIDISGAAVTVEPKEFVADGSRKEPKVTVTLSDGVTVLAEGEDYTVAYADNVEPGTATVTVTGVGRYAGTATGQFTIKEPTPETVDKSALQAKWDEVKDYVESDYRSGWSEFAAARDAAAAVLADEAATVEQVRDALDALESAASKLVRADGDGKDDGKDDGDKKPSKPTRRPVLSRTGVAVLGVGGVMVALVAAGVSLTIVRKRRA